jgi:glucose-6-phosphate isomerase
MDLSILPILEARHEEEFNAEHPMFEYNVPAVNDEAKACLAKADHIVVIGMGGSVLPLKAFVYAADLQNKVHFVDTVDPTYWERITQIPNAVYCLVSKSGATLEVKTVMAELVESGKIKDCLVVTDSQNGFLREYASEHKLPSLDIPSDIGGRFTNFTVFHRAVLEKFGVDFDSMLTQAQKVRDMLKEKPLVLNHLFENMFESGRKNLVIWAYGERLYGFAQWVQQALAESLGKKNKKGLRVGNLPIVLKGPQDQHSVLQLLVDGPQERDLWFFVPKESETRPNRNLKNFPEEFNKMGMANVLDILAESTYRTFLERLEKDDTAQPLARWIFREGMNDIVSSVVIVQALVEYSGKRLKIDAFDQPGVERGKEIARGLLAEL